LEFLPAAQALEARLRETLVVIVSEGRIVSHAAAAALSRQAPQFGRVHVPWFGIGPATRVAAGAQGEQLLAVAALVPRLASLSVVVILEYVVSGFQTAVVAKRVTWRHRIYRMQGNLPRKKLKRKLIPEGCKR